MLHLLKRFWLVLALSLCGSQSLFGFALLGPFNEAYQVPTIGYNLTPPASAFRDEGDNVDIGAPKNLGQGYRWNTPTNYYAYDPTFLQYFGSNGVVAIDAAFAQFNGLANASQMNPDDYPFKSTRVNYRAQALQLLDLKSYMMSALIEQFGLAQPDRWAWCLHDRFLPGGAQCPNYEYLIIQRNYDPDAFNYTPFVNGVLYDYQILELCVFQVNPYAPLEADAVEVQVDPTTEADSFGSVAAYGSVNPFGSFFLGFTRDDIGGWKYLYSATNAFLEAAETNSLQIVTNLNQQLLVTQDLGVFLQQARTNTPAGLIALYPGLVITATTNAFTNVVTTNVTAFLTNPPFAPAGTLQLVFATNFTTNVQQLFFNTYANLQIVHAYPKGFVSQQTISLKQVPFAPAGVFQTNVTTTTKFVNYTNGDFYILPTNLCGPYQILATQLVTLLTNTTIIPISTNGVVITTNSTSIPISTAVLTYFTNYQLVVNEVDCATNAAALRQGVEHLTFVRRDFDSLLNGFWLPVTNLYQITAITNGAPVVQTFRRIITAPDILVSAQDLAAGPAGAIFDAATVRSFPRFNTQQVPNNQGGPGTIAPGVNISFNSVGPIYYNVGPFLTLTDGTIDFLQTNSFFLFQWGSFDASTNTPIVYPDSASIANLELQLFFQVTTGVLPTASVSGNGSGNSYGYSLQATGGSPASAPAAPYVWSLTVDSAGLPQGMTLTPDGVLSGSPTKPGIYDFTVQAVDIGNQRTVKDLFLEVDP